ncbi:hypothetical protein VTN02DRAFT_5749 [Thermoascus thermophilus]
MASSASVTSPRLSVQRDVTPPAVSDPALSHVHDRLNKLESTILVLRSTVLTQDGYVDRRNREDEYIRREFENHHSISSRIDFNVSLLRTDVEQLKAAIAQLELRVVRGETEVGFLRSDVERLQKQMADVRTEIEQLQIDVCGCRIEISKLQATVSQIRLDFMNLQREMTRKFDAVFDRLEKFESRMDNMESRMENLESRMENLESRMENMESRMENMESDLKQVKSQLKNSERVRFNSLAHSIHAPITPVPMLGEDGSFRWPVYFPRTVWRFWCLKKKSRLHRLAELAEFYQLEGYEYWGRMQRAHDDLAPGDSDSSDNESPSNLTRSEAARLYPEACHQALAATLGLVYYKIRNEVGEGPNSHLPPRPPKRLQEEAASSASSKQKPVKIARRPNNASFTTTLHRLVTVQPPETKSEVSEEMDKLGWYIRASDVSEETASKVRDAVTNELRTILRGVERGHIRVKPSRSEQGNMSPTGSKHGVRSGHDAAQKDEVRTIPNTVSTEPISPVAGKDDPLPDAASDASGPAN